MGKMIDKAAWGDGPWQSEPDELEWVDKVTGLKCHIKRNNWMGMWLGYVSVPAGHPAFGQHYDQVNGGIGMNVHGGLTCSREGDDGSWVLGFDCGHAFDFIPGLDARLPPHLRELRTGLMQEYRDLAFVRRECTNLAWQLKGRGAIGFTDGP